VAAYSGSGRHEKSQSTDDTTMHNQIPVQMYWDELAATSDDATDRRFQQSFVSRCTGYVGSGSVETQKKHLTDERA
jgi:hypothetical protein